MGDIIEFLEFLQKLEQGRLIPTEQIEHLADILENTLRKNLSNGVYDSLSDLLEGQLNSNEQNSLFIDILETTPKTYKKKMTTLNKITEFLDDLSKDYPSNTSGFEYNLNFKSPSQDRDYLEIFKDPDQGYILKYANISDYSRYNYTTPLKDLDKKYLNDIWDAIQEMNSNQ